MRSFLAPPGESANGGAAVPNLDVDYNFFDDHRFRALARKVGRRMALGVCLEMWKLAADYWARDRSLIPEKVWAIEEFPPEVLEYDLAEKRDGGIYVRGTSERAEWRAKRVEAGRTGGRASAVARIKNINNIAQATVEQPLSTRQATVKPLPYSSLPCSSLKKSINTFAGGSDDPPRSERKPSSQKVVKNQTGAARVRESFLAAYRRHTGREYPAWGRKENSQAASWLSSVSLERALAYCEAYPAWNDPYVVRAGHPFGLLISQYVRLDAALKDGAAVERRAAEGRLAMEEAAKPKVKSVSEIMDEYEREKNASTRVRFADGQTG